MEKINIAELLRNCPKGMELDSPMYENLYFDGIDETQMHWYPIKCYTVIPGLRTSLTFSKFGEPNRITTAKCVIFPKGETTWEGFQRPFKDGDIIYVRDESNDTTFTCVAILKQIEKGGEIKSYCFYNYEDDYFSPHDYLFCNHNTRFATEEEKEELFNAINDSGYCWNFEKNTLENLIKPKPKPCFKCGDKIRHKKNKAIIKTISYIYKDSYALYDGHLLFFSEQDQYELIPNKFDILMLKPFTKVLVRDFDNETWEINFFARLLNGKHFKCLDLSYAQCIPYEGNEHLHNTTDKCNEFYETWKK